MSVAAKVKEAEGWVGVTIPWCLVTRFPPILGSECLAFFAVGMPTGIAEGSLALSFLTAAVAEPEG